MAVSTRAKAHQRYDKRVVVWTYRREAPLNEVAAQRIEQSHGATRVGLVRLSSPHPGVNSAGEQDG
jgi:hypothetical protein